MRAIDLETTGLDFNRDRIVITGCAGAEGDLVYHNGKFDVKFLRRSGQNITYDFDTMLAASLLTDKPARLGLEFLCKQYLGVTEWKDETQKMFKKPWWTIPEMHAAMEARNSKDVNYTLELANVLKAKLDTQGMSNFFNKLLMPAARMLLDSEYRGMRIHTGKLTALHMQLTAECSQLICDMNAMAGTEVDWNSPKQVLAILRAQGLQPQAYDYKKRITRESTNYEALQAHKSVPLVANLLHYRDLFKTLGFLESWNNSHYEGRLYPQFNLAGTRTGRLSCSQPNLQQVPRDKRIRELFIPTEGKCFVIADYAQIEPRIAAHYSQDAALLDVFRSGTDFYGSIANRVLGIEGDPNKVKVNNPAARQLAKTIGLSILYGIGAKKLSDMIKNGSGQEVSEKECQLIKRQYFKAYPGLEVLRKRVEERVMDVGYVTNHYGRKIPIDKQKLFSTGVNSLIQSSASDACLFTQLPFHNSNQQLVAIVHDEIIYECDPAHAAQFLQQLKATMENQNFNCPLLLEGKVCYDWSQK